MVEAFFLGNFAGPSFVGQNHLAPYVGAAIGVTGVPATRIEAACASSGSAFFHAVSSVAAGLYDLVLVVGVEKMTSQPTPRVAEILAGAGDLAGEVKAGATFPALFAMIARRHMYQYGTRREDLAAVAVKNHANGAKNPYAHMRKVITPEQALAGKPVSEPLTVYDCSLVSDGAAAVLVAGQGGQLGPGGREGRRRRGPLHGACGPARGVSGDASAPVCASGPHILRGQEEQDEGGGAGAATHHPNVPARDIPVHFSAISPDSPARASSAPHLLRGGAEQRMRHS
jgi:acetyl-CoA acetyltransferase